MRHAVFGLATAVVCTFRVAGNAAAQRVSAAAVSASTTHDLLDRPHGFAASMSFPLAGRWSWSIAAERVRGDRTGVGVVCAGLINPDRCLAEPFTQDGRLTLGGVGVEASLVRTSHLELIARPQLLAGQVTSTERGLASGNSLSAGKTQIGFSAGLELRISPVRRLPLDLIGGATASRVGPLMHDTSPDAYTPFERWFSVRSVYAGISLAMRTPRDRPSATASSRADEPGTRRR